MGKVVKTKEKKRHYQQEETFVARKRHKMGLAMKKNHPNAFLLLDEIAIRARRKAGEITTSKRFRYYLEAGECLVPTYSEMGMTRSEWRHALKVLHDKYQQISTYEIGQGMARRTVARLMSNKIFDINLDMKKRLDEIKRQIEKNAKPAFEKSKNATDNVANSTTDTTTNEGFFKDNKVNALEGQIQNHDHHNDQCNSQYSDHYNNNDLNNKESKNTECNNQRNVPAEHRAHRLASLATVAPGQSSNSLVDVPAEPNKDDLKTSEVEQTSQRTGESSFDLLAAIDKLVYANQTAETDKAVEGEDSPSEQPMSTGFELRVLDPPQINGQARHDTFTP